MLNLDGGKMRTLNAKGPKKKSSIFFKWKMGTVKSIDCCRCAVTGSSSSKVISQMHNESLWGSIERPKKKVLLQRKLLYLILIYDDHSLWISFLFSSSRHCWCWWWWCGWSESIAATRSSPVCISHRIEKRARESLKLIGNHHYMYRSSAYIHGRKACNFKASRKKRAAI